MTDLAMLILNICNVIPAGIVCFFTSYDIMDQFYKHIVDTKMIEKIQQKKKFFKESRFSGQQTEKMLSDYAKSIKSTSKCLEPGSQSGAIMFSVIGGKLSEGLNFSDDLGRCVCVIGLPFPNKSNPELAEKMKYLDKIALEHKSHPNSGNSNNANAFASRDFYENLCMKAVNQSIGRAIRHINDFATVLLIDERYQQNNIQKKLPNWIRSSLNTPANFGSVQSALIKFFRSKK